MPVGSHNTRLNHTSRQTRVWLRRVLWGLIALLYIASIPWYREADAPLRIVLGLPDWVAVAIGCYAAAAVLNAVAWLLSAQLTAEESPDGEAGR